MTTLKFLGFVFAGNVLTAAYILGCHLKEIIILVGS